MCIELEMVRRSDDAFRVYNAFMRSIPLPVEPEAGAFYHVVTVLSDSAKSNYVTLRKAFDDEDHALLAWSCRNLLELAIFTKFALASKSNASEFAADRLIDGYQIGATLKQLQLHLDPTQSTSAVEAVMDTYNKQIKAEGICRTRFLDVRELAKRVGMREIYDPINRLCSKFVHPTAWNLFTADAGPERFPDATDIFFGCGAEYFHTVHAEILPHIRQWGLKHKA